MSPSREARAIKKLERDAEPDHSTQTSEKTKQDLIQRAKEREEQGLPPTGPEVPTPAQEYRDFYNNLDSEDQARREPPEPEEQERAKLKALVRRRQEWAAGRRAEWRE